MAGSIVISSIQLDVDNNFSILSNTGTTLLSANASGLNVTSSFADNSISSDKIVSIANTKIDGLVTDNQIASVSNTKIDGLITNDQVASVANTKIDGLITDDQVASVSNTKIDGLITSDQIANIAADKIVGTLGGNYVLTSFTSPGTWTKPTDLKAIKVTVIGGGGGGNGGRENFGDPSTGGIGGGGGGGGVSIEYITAPAIPGPVSVTVGSGGAGGPAPGSVGVLTAGSPGGSSSFGAFLSATGGSGAPNSGYVDASVGGSGGTGSGGNFNLEGFTGNVPSPTNEIGFRPSTPSRYKFGGGGNPIFITGYGRNAISGAGPSGVAGEDAVANQGGGGGGHRSVARSSPTVDGVPVAGGAGGAGIVIVEEFY